MGLQHQGWDGPLTLQVNFPIVDTTHSKGNKFVADVKIKVTGDSKLNDSPTHSIMLHSLLSGTGPQRLNYFLSWDEGGGLPYKKGCFLEILKRNPKSYQDPILWAWYENI